MTRLLPSLLALATAAVLSTAIPQVDERVLQTFCGT